MADATYYHTFESKGNTSDGHYVKWRGPQIKLPRTPNYWRLKKKFETCCGSSPSSWEILISIMRIDGTTSLSVLVIRLDGDIQLALVANVHVEVMDAYDHPVFPKQAFLKEGMVPGNHLQENVDLVPYTSMDPAVDECPGITVLVHLTISYCHGNE